MVGCRRREKVRPMILHVIKKIKPWGRIVTWCSHDRVNGVFFAIVYVCCSSDGVAMSTSITLSAKTSYIYFVS